MKVDMVEVGIVGVLCIAVLIDGLRKYKQWNTYRQPLEYAKAGLLLLLATTLLNSWAESRWELDYILSFLILEKVGSLWMFRYFTAIGYICLAMSIEILAIVISKKSKSD